MSAPAHRKGWCPGALRPMASGDGLLVRLRITGGTLSADLARALAECAESFGNGRIDLSSRANLQLRGVTEATLPALQARLDCLGLIDSDPEAEAVRNILASPLAGFDSSALLDIGPCIEALDERLRSDRTLHNLPGKFLFLVDDGGALPLPHHAADIAFVAKKDEEGSFFAVRLGGTLAGRCGVEDLCETATRLAHAFLDLRRDDDRRMVDLIRRIGVAPIASAAELARMTEEADDRERARPRLLGLHRLGTHAALGLGIPFGRLDGKALRQLADAAAAVGGTLRLSPWRAVFVIAEHLGEHFAERMREAGFILADDAPIRSVAACPGKPACLHGACDSQSDAARLAPRAQALAADGLALHVSACAKGCAYPDQAPVTLVGCGGTYDMVLEGRASDVPMLQGLSLADVESLLARLAALPASDRVSLAQALLYEAVR